MARPSTNSRETFHEASATVHVQYATEKDNHPVFEIDEGDLIVIDGMKFVSCFPPSNKKSAISFAEGYAKGKSNYLR